MVFAQAQLSVRRMWDDIHSLTYDIFDAAAPPAAEPAGVEQPAAQLPHPVRQVCPCCLCPFTLDH